jgi:hypothetical protein
MAVKAMLEWLKFLRNQICEYQQDRFIHLILDGCATHLRGHPDLPARLSIVLHFIPPGLTDLLQRLDRSVFAALKAEYRAIYRMDMSQREDKRMTKADFAACLILAWELVSEGAVRGDWECFYPDTGAYAGTVAGRRWLVTLFAALWWVLIGAWSPGPLLSPGFNDSPPSACCCLPHLD